jgi:hypothetical protein
MQESCLRLMGEKLLVSLGLEGKFANDGLQAFDEDDDMLTAMAHELITQKGVGERADNVWRQLQRQTTTVVTAVETPQPVLACDIALPAIVPPLSPSQPAPLALADFASPARRVGSPPLARPHENQLNLAF